MSVGDLIGVLSLNELQSYDERNDGYTTMAWFVRVLCVNRVDTA